MSHTILDISDIYKKLESVESSCELANKSAVKVPNEPARDISVLPLNQHPQKIGFSSKEGQARLLHDLANIELQAMELAFRTLCEFPEAPKEFKEQLIELTVSESKHLKLCLDGIQDMGFQWGHWPAHLSLWGAVSSEDSLLDRILIVHRYLEGSGLDAGETILMKLIGIPNNLIKDTVKTIVEEEIEHVRFGSKWYKDLCKLEKIDADNDFKYRLHKLNIRLPRRLERLSWNLRKQAGFSDFEILCLSEMQKQEKDKKYARTHSV